MLQHLMLIMLMIRGNRFSNPVMVQKMRRRTGIFSQDQINLSQYI